LQRNLLLCSYGHSWQLNTVIHPMVWSFIRPTATGMNYMWQLLDLWACTSTTSFSTFTDMCYVLFPLGSHLFFPVCSASQVHERWNVCPYVLPVFCGTCILLSGLHSGLHWWIICSWCILLGLKLYSVHTTVNHGSITFSAQAL
jgi:hypothetical protein